MIPRSLFVHFLPELTNRSGTPHGIAVIIDVLRASSTIVTALRNGATAIRPCASPDEGRAIRTSLPPGQSLLGGERGGVRIEGFDLGNSPADYTTEVVGGRTVIFTTTNGTRALLSSAWADQILIGCFLNLSATTAILERSHKPVHLVCAGTDGDVTGEDVLFAGAVVQRLMAAGSWQLNDSARIAAAYWTSVPLSPQVQRAAESGTLQAVTDNEPALATAFRQTRGGANLVELGYGPDLALCSFVDAAQVVAEYDQTAKEIRIPA